MSAFSGKSSTKATLVDKLEIESLRRENPLLLELEYALARLASSKLTKLQKRILLELYQNGNGDHTLSSLVRKFSAELGVPESTLKWSLRGLRDIGLIASGNIEVKGIPVSLTYAGMVVAKYMTEEGLESA
ncbi:MAG: hypothetical protein ACXQTI_01985 [Candidatus Nezhaarchaeales archaeon]